MGSFESVSIVNYHAIVSGNIVYRGTMSDLVRYIATKRASGLDVKCGADGATTAEREQRSRDLENHLEVYVLGFRLEEANGVRGVYLPELFQTEEAAQLHRTQSLGDVDGEKYSIVPVNWRGALL